MNQYTGDWHGLYREGWGKEIIPDAYAHPAKFARGLIRRIYAHLIEQGYLKSGDTVMDPFGGVGLGALEATLREVHWIGCELEARFVELGRQNLELWEERYRRLWPNMGRAVLLQGDSRQLGAVLRGAWGQAEGVVSSPPFAEQQSGGGIAKSGTPGQRGCRNSVAPAGYQHQGTAPGQLGRMPEGEIAEALVSSPPFQDQSPSHDKAENYQGFEHVGSIKAGAVGYGYNTDNPANIGNDTGDDFWHAARQIVDECYRLLAPGAVAVWVVKRFVRNKQIVPFPDQWRQMCEAAGFETVEWIRAWVVEEHGEQLDLFGNGHAVRKERKSFFRRLYESKYPDNAIDWEDVLVMRRKP